MGELKKYTSKYGDEVYAKDKAEANRKFQRINDKHNFDVQCQIGKMNETKEFLIERKSAIDKLTSGMQDAIFQGSDVVSDELEARKYDYIDSLRSKIDELKWKALSYKSRVDDDAMEINKAVNNLNHNIDILKQRLR